MDEVKGIMLDCYKTLVDIKTDERSISTYEPLSRWLMYHGINIGPQELMNEYRRLCKEEIERNGIMHSGLKVEEIFAGICRRHASWDINELTVGIEAACLFRSASLRRLQVYPQSIRMLEVLKCYPMGIISNG